MTKNIHDVCKNSETFGSCVVSFCHLLEDLAWCLSISSNIINVLFEKRFHAFFNSPAWETGRRTTSCCNIYFLTDWSINIFRIPWSESASATLTWWKLLSHNLNFTARDDFPFDSHITNNWFMKTSAFLIVSFRSTRHPFSWSLKSRPSFGFKNELRSGLNSSLPAVNINWLVIVNSINLAVGQLH